MGDEDIATMTVPELRACLKQEGQDSSGPKNVLVARLEVVRKLRSSEHVGSKKRKREEADERLGMVTCPICEEITPSPIMQCENGHVICSGCVVRLRPAKICPSCRVSLAKMSRNLVVESTCASLPVPCCFKGNGCTQKVEYQSYKDH
eukprot:732946-Pyramimonas_sp.AAC.1